MTVVTAPVATVTCLYRETEGGFEQLTEENPLTLEELRERPVFFGLWIEDSTADLVMDVSYDNMEPVQLPALFRGLNLPRGIRFWPGWFEVPPYREARDVTGRRVYPRAPGTHTVRIRTAPRRRSAAGTIRDFSPANRGFTSPLFELAIAAEAPAGEEVPGTRGEAPYERRTG